MLKHLHIRNFAIVDTLELDFDAGMIVLTGETGAGKSILLDALGLCLGDRADSMTVRTGTDRAEVSAAFTIGHLKGVRAWLEEHELEADDECLIRRTVGADGRSKAYVNGQMVPVTSLKELGEQLVDIHGQHAHQSLLRRDAQRELLDEFAGHGAQVEQLAALFRRWRELREEYARLSKAQSERDARLELLRYQVGELKALGLQHGEIAKIEEEHQRLANSTRLM
jgi:DNA repair protein RecN (Recombination protein N)